MTFDTEIESKNVTSTNDLSVATHQIEEVTTPENEDDSKPNSIPMITPEKEIIHDQRKISQSAPTQNSDNITCTSKEHEEYSTVETVEYQPKLLSEKEIHDQEVFHQSKLRHNITSCAPKEHNVFDSLENGNLQTTFPTENEMTDYHTNHCSKHEKWNNTEPNKSKAASYFPDLLPENEDNLYYMASDEMIYKKYHPARKYEEMISYEELSFTSHSSNNLKNQPNESFRSDDMCITVVSSSSLSATSSISFEEKERGIMEFVWEQNKIMAGDLKGLLIEEAREWVVLANKQAYKVYNCMDSLADDIVMAVCPVNEKKRSVKGKRRKSKRGNTKRRFAC